MKSARSSIVVVSVALAMVLFCRTAWPRNSAGGDWTARHFPAAFEELFPIRLAQGEFIAVRVHRSKLNDLREYSVVFEDAQDSKALRAVVREAQGSSLYRQLAALHAAQPSASYDELKPNIKVGVWRLSADRCPAVSTQFKAFENIEFVRPHDDDEPEENPILYEFNETFAGGGSVLEYMENRALPRWARATHRALDACIASGDAAAK
jgi:hypothetical protein